jgi:Protein of unknown function (DUF2971)
MNEEELQALFVPHLIERRNMLKDGQRLVHYTSATNAYLIITGRQFWLRNAQMMNDFSEIQHGLNCLYKGWESPAGIQLQAMLERIEVGLRDKLANAFDNIADSLRLGTFIASMSEHRDDEDKLGRLSMWRAYGGRAGVALVLNNNAFVAETDEMRVYSAPVFYQEIEEFVIWFENWAASLIAAENAINTIGSERLFNTLFMVFRFFALCTKHPGFAEEREWRVFYSPVFEGHSDWVDEATEIIEDVPQILMKLRLVDNLEKGIVGVAPATLIDRVIIGPCDYPLQVRAGIASALMQAGIENPLDKLWMSLIPYRHR